MLSVENLEAIRADGRRILELARRDPDRTVPQYPGWTMRDLLSHTASIHARTTRICRDRPGERPSTPSLPEDADVLDWYQTSLAEMVEALEEEDPDAKVWGFVAGATIGFWERRMVIETGVHRWDAEQAFGEERPLSEMVAVSGLEEYTDMWLPRLGEMPVIEVCAEDMGRSWWLGSGTPVTTVTGTASDLYLRLITRPSPVTLPDDWARAVDRLEPPRK